MERLKTPTAPRTDSAVQLRHQALAPFLEQFREWSSQLRDPRTIPHSAEIAAHPMDLGCWERSVLQQACAADSRDGRAVELLAEGVAYQARCLYVVGLFTHGPMPPPSELPQFLDQLVTDVAVGMALADELQREINEMISDGRRANTKPLSEFCDKIVRCLAELRERVGAAELEQAERRVATLVAIDLRAEQASRKQAARLLEEELEAPSWAAFGSGRPEPESPPQPVEDETPVPAERPAATLRSQVRPLLYVLAALTVLYGLVMLPRIGGDRLPVLTLEQFAHLEAVQRIRARPPSLFVTVRPDRWHQLSPAERRDLVTEIGRIANGVEYSGVHVRTTGGPSVGQWLKKTGVQIWARPAGAS